MPNLHNTLITTVITFFKDITTFLISAHKCGPEVTGPY